MNKVGQSGERDWSPSGRFQLSYSKLECQFEMFRRQPITSICISLNSTILLVGTSEGLIYLYDIPSHQLLRSIPTHKGMSISHIQTLIKPPDLIGHVSLQMQAGVDAKDDIPVKPVVPFQKIRDAKARVAHEVTLLLPRIRKVYMLRLSIFCTVISHLEL